MKEIRVVVVDDSEVIRSLLKTWLQREGDIRVVGEAENGAAAIGVVSACRPDIVTMDVEMPGMNGLEAIEQIMALTPVPILVVSGLPGAARGGELAFEAIRRGALEVALKPDAQEEGDDPGASLRSKLRLLSRVYVVRHSQGRRRTTSGFPAVSEAAIRAAASQPHLAAVGVAASAGGPAAIASVISGLPRDFPVCVALVQHLSTGFTEPFSRFLREHTRLKVVVADDDHLRAEAGTLLIAPEGAHLVAVTSQTFGLARGAPVGGHRPSATALFRSMAKAHGARGAGVILSGMGEDGVDGLLEMRAAGALTIAQDRETTAVYGMPRAAVEKGAAARVLPVDDIAGALVRAAGKKPGV